MKDKSSVLILTCDAYSNCWKGLGLKPSMDLRSDTEAPARTAQRSEGRRPVSAGRPAVLAVAHLAGSTLFGAERSFLTLLDGFSAIDDMNALFHLYPENVFLLKMNYWLSF